MLGSHYTRMVASDGSTSLQGTVVDVDMITNVARTMIQKMTLKPTCLNNVKDTTKALYSSF